MNVVSFYAPRPEHPFFQDYSPYLDLLSKSVARYGHKHVCLTDDPAVADGFCVPLPRPLMRAYLAAQLAYLEAHPDTPSLMTGADCVLAQDPQIIADQCGASDIVITTDWRFTDCHVNMGAIYLPRPGLLVPVWQDALARCGDEWGDDQRAFRDALEASDVVVRELPCDPYNLAPDHPGDDCRRGFVLHFRGPRKAWMADYCAHWLGIGSGVVVKMAPNTDAEVGIAQVVANLTGQHECLTLQEPHRGVAVLVGSGPSAADMLPLIRGLSEGGAALFGLNGAARWLAQEGVTPDFGVLLDMREGNRRFVDGMEPAQGWIMASHCHPDVVAAASLVRLFHNADPAYYPYLPPGSALIGGGPTVGISAMYVACVLGFRRLHLFGYDSSFRGEQTHLLPQPISDAEAVPFEVHHGARTFRSNAAMYAQASAFQPACDVLLEGVPGLQIHVHGDGLLPSIAHEMNANAAQAA